EHYQLHADSRVLMTLSRISPEKGIHHLLEALALVEKSPRLAGADIVVFVCGEPAFMRGDAYLRRVRSAADRLQRVRVFFPGYLSGCGKQAYFRLADLFVSPSEHESYGLTIVEALRSGLPVAASDHAGAEEILRPEYGRMAAYGDPPRRAERLAEELSDLLADPEELRRMGARAREASKHMTFADAAGRLLEAVLGMRMEIS
ncbi:MAG: glycosyltransferase, partial [Elusimicrobiota bacterium]